MPLDNLQQAEVHCITIALLHHKNSPGSVKPEKQMSQSIEAAGGQYMHELSYAYRLIEVITHIHANSCTHIYTSVKAGLPDIFGNVECEMT